jgi:hypothetical protein
MDNKNSRTVQIGVGPVARVLIDAEERYLSDAKAGPGEDCLVVIDMPAFDAQTLMQNLGNVIEGVSQRDTQRYFVPGPGRIFTALRSERDKLVTVKGAAAGNRIVACNRLMKALRARKQIY